MTDEQFITDMNSQYEQLAQQQQQNPYVAATAGFGGQSKQN